MSRDSNGTIIKAGDGIFTPCSIPDYWYVIDVNGVLMAESIDNRQQVSLGFFDEIYVGLHPLKHEEICYDSKDD